MTENEKMFSAPTLAEAIENYFDPQEFYQDELPSWASYWDWDKTHYQNLGALVKKLVILPNQQIYLPIAITYLMQPTRPARCLPVLACIGESGSGKSTFTKLAFRLRGLNNTFSPKDTFASVRNAIDAMRYIYPDCKTYEKEGAIVCWDNLDIKKIDSDDGIYSVFVVGYQIQTAIMSIAHEKGKNLTFNTFCPKIISTIDPIHTHPKFSELQRRLWVIPHKVIQKFTTEEINQIGDGFVDFQKYKLEFDGINWSEIENVFFNFWDLHNCKKYVAYRSYLASQKAKYNLVIPDNLAGSAWDVIPDIVATGLCIGTWHGYQQAIDAISLYLNNVQGFSEVSCGVAIDYIKKHTASEVERCLQSNTKIIVDASRLKLHLENLAKAGCINETVTPKKISEWMNFLGYEITMEGWAKK